MNKKILISCSIIAVLILYIIVTNIKRSGDVLDLPKWDGNADEVLITSNDGAIKLFKKEGKWVAGENAYPADAKAIGEIEKRFKEIHITDLISSKGYYAKYDLTPDKYIEVILKKGDATLRKFKIGKKSSTNRHTFIRVDDRPEIYLAEGTFDLVLNKTLDDFRDREVLKINRGSVSSFTVDYQGRVFAFSRESEKKTDSKDAAKNSGKKAVQPSWGNWICRGYETVQLDKTKVETLLQSLDPLRASAFPETPKEELPQRVCTVQIKAGQKDIALTIYKKNNIYVGTTSEIPYIFAVDKWNIEKLFITGIETFKAGSK
jgi:hypothetical protein